MEEVYWHQQLKLLRSEFWESLRLSVRLSVIQFCEAAISFVDILMMGWLSTQTLAAGGLGAVIFLTVLSICMGLVEGVGAIAAAAYSKDDYEQVSQITCMGLWLCLGVSLVAMLLLWQVDAVLPLLGQTEENAKLAGNYLHAILWSFPAALSLIVFKEIATVLGIILQDILYYVFEKLSKFSIYKSWLFSAFSGSLGYFCVPSFTTARSKLSAYYFMWWYINTLASWCG